MPTQTWTLPPFRLYKLWTRCVPSQMQLYCHECKSLAMLNNEVDLALELPRWKIRKEQAQCSQCKRRTI